MREAGAGEALCCLVTSQLYSLSWTSLQMYLSLANLWTLPVLYFFLPESLSWLIMNKKLERAEALRKTLNGSHQQSQGGPKLSKP